MFIKLRKNQIFYKQYFYIDLLERYENDEYRLISNILQFGEELLYHITLKGLVLCGLCAKYFQPRKTKPML